MKTFPVFKAKGSKVWHIRVDFSQGDGVQVDPDGPMSACDRQFLTAGDEVGVWHDDSDTSERLCKACSRRFKVD